MNVLETAIRKYTRNLGLQSRVLSPGNLQDICFFSLARDARFKVGLRDILDDKLAFKVNFMTSNLLSIPKGTMASFVLKISIQIDTFDDGEQEFSNAFVVKCPSGTAYGNIRTLTLQKVQCVKGLYGGFNEYDIFFISTIPPTKKFFSGCFCMSLKRNTLENVCLVLLTTYQHKDFALVKFPMKRLAGFG